MVSHHRTQNYLYKHCFLIILPYHTHDVLHSSKGLFQHYDNMHFIKNGDTSKLLLSRDKFYANDKLFYVNKGVKVIDCR